MVALVEYIKDWKKTSSMRYVFAHIKSMVALVEYVLLLCLHMAAPLYKIKTMNGTVLLLCLHMADPL
jgi:hypothetical protein